MRKKILTKDHSIDFMKLSEVERSRLAMAVDTDGCITYNYYNDHAYAYPTFVFTGASLLPIKLWERYGGAIQNYRPTIFKWIIKRREALQDFLRAVQPYLLIKREQCEIALQMLGLLLEKPAKLPGYPGWKQKTLYLAEELNRSNSEYKHPKITLEEFS